VSPWKIQVNQIKLSCVEMDVVSMEVRRMMECARYATKTQFRKRI